MEEVPEEEGTRPRANSVSSWLIAVCVEEEEGRLEEDEEDEESNGAVEESEVDAEEDEEEEDVDGEEEEEEEEVCVPSMMSPRTACAFSDTVDTVDVIADDTEAATPAIPSSASERLIAPVLDPFLPL